MKNRVLVTGIGLVTPLRPFAGAEAFWDAVCSGEDAVRWMPPPLIDAGRKWLMAGIDITGRSEHVCSEDKILFIAEEALRMAVKDARLPEDRKSGLSVGTVLGNILFKEKRLMEGNPHKTKNSFSGESLSNINSFLAKTFNIKGGCITISTACASGTDAIGIAARKISSGEENVIVAGGADVLSDFAVMGFHSLHALTEEKVRPFDKNRSGLALGEGAAFMVLESEKHAAQRDAKIYGRIMGYASRADANHLTAPHRDGRGLVAAMSQAISEAGIKPAEIDYINAHGTGTIYNDRMETLAIKKVFGDAAYSVPVSSTKSMLGHSFGAAGAIETICCLLSINHKKIHPTINYTERDPECDLDYVPDIARRSNVNTAMSLSAGFGGQNSVIITGGI
ncbi:MAG: beta-ketoacyl-[acyl-carrier-protein] synthase family protein [Nitrospiraceae bacterium]|nr:MAG: beta-ketoacyl-[acyl-carrier-protein] synthase family protein [Nitrospiraceae bacterium]